MGIEVTGYFISICGVDATHAPISGIMAQGLVGIRSGECAGLTIVVEFRYSRFSTMKSKDESHPPLSPAALQILAALATEDLHGYGIIQAVSVHSQGRVRIGPGTLYDNLKRFMEQGWVRDLQPASENEKRLYRLTGAGKSALSYEISRLDHLVRQTKRYLQGMKPRSVE
jgi:DNA-binding PadR family transcriptional regulator